uniref:Uncharacterized protein n=1 Tax=Timema monikensis TaxID=170555 RepID=A0A7R9EIF0_9NEOP|nr:unnamed protein product [Timema monikensis]
MWICNVTIMVAILHYFITSYSCDWSKQADIKERNQLVRYAWPDCIPGVRKRGNTVREQLSLKSADKQSPFYTACLKCDACLAIAEKLNESLLFVHKNLETKLNESYANSVLSLVCERGFENYALQKLHGYTTLMESASWSDLIPTTLDGMWTDKLRELCRYYLSEFGATRLYDSGEGVFRDCLNIVDKILLYKPSRKRGELPFGVVYRSTCCPCQ